MRTLGTAAIVCSALAWSACGGRRPVEINPEAQAAGTLWHATLGTPAAMAGALQVRGSAWMGASEKDSTQTMAHVEISNAPPGGKHPWHVHLGQCGQDRGILGPADAYPPLDVKDDGTAKEDATLPLPMPKQGQYFVNVHAAANNMGTIIACGNMAPQAR